MGFWDTIKGQSRPKLANLDSLFQVPGAAIALQTEMGFMPTGDGSVCYRAATGAAHHETQTEILELLRGTGDSPEVRVSTDSFGFTWIEIDREPGADVEGLCTGLHAVNTSLEAQGFGTGLLCTLVTFEDAGGRRLALVYLYKQGTFYPFAPAPGADRQRDNLLEIQVRDTLDGELPVEKELSRWLAVWGAPGL